MDTVTKKEHLQGESNYSSPGLSVYAQERCDYLEGAKVGIIEGWYR